MALVEFFIPENKDEIAVQVDGEPKGYLKLKSLKKKKKKKED